ncbi:MAG: DUF3467 domain-containing protein, partial [Planctomycetaceae bacterium]|nr:DUF3467 domain-containing protein [Planctomycetaceae bacterium]
ACLSMPEPSHHEPDDPRDQPLRGEVRYSQLSARVPGDVGQGVFCNAVLVLTGPFEYVLDFVMRLSEAPRIVARVVLPRPVVGQFVRALEQNVANYEGRFGPLPRPPKLRLPAAASDVIHEPGTEELTRIAAPPVGDAGSFQGIAGEGFESGTPAASARPGEESVLTGPPIEQIYDDLRLPDDMLSGRYANAVLIRHSGTEFCLDFITNIYPRSAVSNRVYMAAANVHSLLTSLSRSLEDRRPPDPPT